MENVLQGLDSEKGLLPRASQNGHINGRKNQWVIVVNVFGRITSGVLLLSPRGAWTEWGNRTTKGVIVTVTS